MRRRPPAWVLVGALLVALLTGCAHTVPPEPEVIVDHVTIPVPIWPTLPALEPLVLPEYPEPPAADAPAEDWKAFFAECYRVAEIRERLLAGRVDALEHVLRSIPAANPTMSPTTDPTD